MAKVSGPLMSMTASGSFAKTLTFAQRMGKSVVRHLVTPANPQTAGQVTSRNAVAVAGGAQKWASNSTQIGPLRTETDLALLKAATPAGSTWNAFLVQSMIGKGQVNYTAMKAAWVLIAAGPQVTWNTAALALHPAIQAVAQKAVGGIAGPAATAGFVWFAYQYGLHVALGIAVPGVTPPAYLPA